MKPASSILVLMYMLSIAQVWIHPRDADVHDSHHTGASAHDACGEVAAAADCGCQGSCGDECACCAGKKNTEGANGGSAPLEHRLQLAPASCGCAPDAMFVNTMTPQYCPVTETVLTVRDLRNRLAPRSPCSFSSWYPQPPEHVPIS